MKTKRFLLAVVAGAFFGIAIFIGFEGKVEAKGSAYFSFLAETMRPVDSTIQYDCNDAYLKTIQDSTLQITQYIGSVHLPHGESIISVKGYGIDSSPLAFYFRLYRYNISEDPVWSSITDFAYSDSGSFEGNKTTVTAIVNPDFATVDNLNYSYGLFLVLPADITNELKVLRFVIETTATQRAVVIPMF